MTVSMITGEGKNRRKWELVEEKKKYPTPPPPPENEFLREGDTKSRIGKNQTDG